MWPRTRGSPTSRASCRPERCWPWPSGLTTQRDIGDRTNRKHARLKYTIEDRGLAWFVGEVETPLGTPLAPARPFAFDSERGPLRLAARARRQLASHGEHSGAGRIVDAGGRRRC